MRAILLLTTSIFFSRFCLLELFRVLAVNPLVLDTLIEVTFVTKSSHIDFLTTSLSTTLFNLLKLPETVF